MCDTPSGHEPSLLSQFFGGPLDGRKSADLPAQLAGRPLTGCVMRIPLSEPHYFSLFAVYVCRGATPVDGFWQFFYQRMEGPNGETVDASKAQPQPNHRV